MNRYRQLIFLLAVAYLTTADVPLSTNDDSDTKIISSRGNSRTEPPIQSESSTRAKLPLQEEVTSRGIASSQSQLSTQSQLTTRCELTTRNDPTIRCEFPNRSEPTTRVENSTRVPCADEDVKESTTSASTTDDLASVAAGLRDQVMRLTNQLSKAVAALHTAQQRERKMSVLEREKYSYLKAASEKVLGVVDNLQHTEKGLAVNTSRERQVQQRIARDHRTQARSRRKLQTIRRLLAGAEVGLVHIESSRTLNRCSATSRKPQGAQLHADRSPSRKYHPSDA
eukprot:XP_016664197.1 PREDICTED: uncharacterized protein LOC100570137 [Acyrthosiphon pisum]